MSTYEYYLSEDSVEQFTENSIQTFLENIVDGNVKIYGGKDWLMTLRRMIYQFLSNIYDMFYHQPIMTICLFGVPLAFFSIIAYSVCSADFSVDHEDIYPVDEEDEFDVENDFSEVDELEDENLFQDEGNFFIFLNDYF